MALLTPHLIITAKTSIKRVRELPLDGRVLVKPNQDISATNVVAEAELPGDLFLVRVQDQLGIDKEQFEKSVKIAIGQEISKDEIIAEQRSFFGMFSRQIKAPISGIVEFVNLDTGTVALRAESKRLRCLAYLSGVVTAIDPKRSVTISADVALLQGIFGVGGERVGILHPLNCAPDQEVGIEHIPEQARRLVLCGGMRPKPGVLKEAAARGAVGFVCGSIDAQTLREYVGHEIGVAVTGDEDISMSVVVTEGFGAIPLSERANALFKAGSGKSTSLNGTTQVRAGAIRPEVLIAGGVDLPAAPTADYELKVGAQVRFIRYPLFGQSGEVIELPSAPQKLDTGSHARVLKARLQSGQVVTVPRANIELV